MRQPGRADLVAEAHQVAGQPDDEHQLHRFHHLEVGDAQVDPAPRAVDACGRARARTPPAAAAKHSQQQQLAVLLESFSSVRISAMRQHRRPRRGTPRGGSGSRTADVHALGDRDRTRATITTPKRGQRERRQPAATGRSGPAMVVESGGLARRSSVAHQRTFNVARPTSTSTTRDDPEAHDHARLRPALQFEVVVDRRHAEHALAGELERWPPGSSPTGFRSRRCRP